VSSLSGDQRIDLVDLSELVADARQHLELIEQLLRSGSVVCEGGHLRFFHVPPQSKQSSGAVIEKSPVSCDRSLIGSRRDAELLPERCDEVRRRRVPGSVRHICDRQVGLTKEIHRSLTPPRHHQLMWRRPAHVAKRTDEVVRAQAGCRGKFSERR
jgi:hypothetical protein